MIRKFNWLLLSLSLVPYGAFAQPPEEVPPPLPDNVLEIEAIPADSDLMAPQPEILAQPVAEPLAVPADPEEDKSLKGVSLSPSIGIFPFGYDSINLSGDAPGGETGRAFFMMRPSLDLSTSLRTSMDRTVDFSLNYTMFWREYYNKASTTRDFENDVSASLSVGWTDRISTTLSGLFIHFFKAGSDLDGDNFLLIEATPSLSIKATDQLSFSLGYLGNFVNVPDLDLQWYQMNATTSPPSDLDEFARGIPFSNTTYMNNYSGGGTESYWEATNAATLGVSYTPIKGTTVGLNYQYTFLMFSNNDNALWKGHILTPSVRQALPWKGGTFVLKDQLRLRVYDYGLSSDGQAAKQTFRNRLTIGINQAINKYMTAEFFYRLQLRGENSDNYNDIHPDNWGYMGVSFAF